MPDDPGEAQRVREYVDAVRKTAAEDTVKLPNLIAQLEVECVNDGMRWFPKTFGDVPYLGLCLAGEAGEVANEIKKHCRGDNTDAEARERVAGELVDVLIY